MTMQYTLFKRITRANCGAKSPATTPNNVIMSHLNGYFGGMTPCAI